MLKKRCRGKEMDKDVLVQKSLTLSFRSERNVSLSSFLFLFFFSVARFPVRKTSVSCLAGATPVPHKERRASVALICLHCSKKWMYILTKQCVSSERCAMPKACSVCHHGNKPSNCRRSFPCKMLVWSSSSTWQRRSLFFVKHDKRTNKATNHNDCTNNFQDQRRVARPSAP